MIRIGILGYSDIARRKFIPALHRSDFATLAAIARREPGASVTMADGSISDEVSYHDLVTAPDIDLVYLSLPNHLHEEWCIRALERGKHVLCEKPLGLSVASVRRMIEAADAHGRLLYENLMYLQHPQHRIVKALIKEGRVGQVISLHSEFAFPGPDSGDFRLDSSRGGGAFHDLNRYPVSAALHFMVDEPNRFIRGSVTRRDGMVWSLQAESRSAGGEQFSFLIAFGQPYRSYYEITGTRGRVRVDRAFTTPAELENRIYLTVDGSEEQISVPPYDHFLGTIDHVCGLIRSGVWHHEHQRSERVARLADQFLDACTGKGPADETA